MIPLLLIIERHSVVRKMVILDKVIPRARIHDVRVKCGHKKRIIRGKYEEIKLIS